MLNFAFVWDNLLYFLTLNKIQQIPIEHFDHAYNEEEVNHHNFLHLVKWVAKLFPIVPDVAMPAIVSEHFLFCIFVRSLAVVYLSFIWQIWQGPWSCLWIKENGEIWGAGEGSHLCILNNPGCLSRHMHTAWQRSMVFECRLCAKLQEVQPQLSQLWDFGKIT